MAYGVGAGADMLKPLAVGVIGALCISLLLSLVATPVVYYVLVRVFTPWMLRPVGPVGGTPVVAENAHGVGSNE